MCLRLLPFRSPWLHPLVVRSFEHSNSGMRTRPTEVTLLYHSTVEDSQNDKVRNEMNKNASEQLLSLKHSIENIVAEV